MYSCQRILGAPRGRYAMRSTFMSDAAGKSYIDLTANIVSAYLSNNPTPASEIPNLISQVHSALLRVSSGQ